MKLSCGIVGLPNAGKSTLFNALVLRHKAGVGAHPFTTIDKNIGAAEVPDDTLFQLAKSEQIDKATPTTITFVDIAGLIKGAHQGEGLGNQFLHHIREVELILHVVRFFHNEGVSHVHASIDPQEDIAIVNEELLLADLQSLKNREAKDKDNALIKKLIEHLNRGVAASEIRLDEQEQELTKSLNLLTLKKQLIIANVDEAQINSPLKNFGVENPIQCCAKLEAELNELAWTEQQQFLKTYGLSKPVKEKIISECYRMLDVITFYTIAKHKEAKAWSIRRGKTALDAAEVVHTDFTKRFIKAEAINAGDLIAKGSWKKAHEARRVLLHGKDYIVKDKDVIEFKVGA